MNNKRQTIWLVSMLSLMVVLSAYYLFTGDSGSSKTPVADSQQVGTEDKSAAKESASGTKTTENGVEVTEVITDGKVNDSAAKADTAKNDAANKDASKDAAKDTTADTGKDPAKDTADKTTAKTDAKDQASTDKTASADKTAGATDGKTTAQNGKSDDEVLKEVAAQTQKSSGSSQIESYLFQRTQDNLKKHNDLMAAMNDMTKDAATSAQASEELTALETKENKIQGIEEELEQKYSFANAFVKEEDDKYQVLVLSEKLDVKQAVSIVELVMKELNVSQDKVSVKYMAP
ncbi:10-formyltetrahydrofolate dehydrogenase [Paenibacillus sp. HJL G12]|uniref:10-formyltetrahydrofolate dehydrogenase n=1 Tax=Paenibacillus dendrobii TaxID=2691084 RepID=A0A7X3IJW0_9BACL|nr:SpoIIIAH-like family protein [Paenibacillus dendrobii]MWV45040.1 10-formyltetrahydrofolate dehydrogenase [Paenibacillus dendrobii]